MQHLFFEDKVKMKKAKRVSRSFENAHPHFSELEKDCSRVA
jgi:hypothetical protein